VRGRRARPHAVAGHLIYCQAPALLAAPVDGDHLDVVAASAHGLDQLAVRPLRPAWETARAKARSRPASRRRSQGMRAHFTKPRVIIGSFIHVSAGAQNSITSLHHGLRAAGGAISQRVQEFVEPREELMKKIWLLASVVGLCCGRLWPRPWTSCSTTARIPTMFSRRAWASTARATAARPDQQEQRQAPGAVWSTSLMNDMGELARPWSTTASSTQSTAVNVRDRRRQPASRFGARRAARAQHPRANAALNRARRRSTTASSSA